jgi:short-subunit dehydrogenase
VRIAIITGASSGMGREFVRHADRTGGFDAIWAVARREERLHELAGECTTPLRPVVLDLSAPSSIDELHRLLEAAAREAGLAKVGDEGFSVGLLVNAAGFGKFGSFRDLMRSETDTMIALNCRVPVDLTQLAVRYMRKGSRIIEVVSSASFQPLPYMSLYAATKAFLLSYTRSLRWELVGTGIHATALCPGWVRTEFAQVAKDTANPTAVRHQQPSISARTAVGWSSFINACNLPVATCSPFMLVQRIFSKFVPNPVAMAIWEGIRRI